MKAHLLGDAAEKQEGSIKGPFLVNRKEHNPSPAAPELADAPPEMIEEAMDDLCDEQILQSADNLELARTLWRTHRSLVEADEFAEPYRTAFMNNYGREPSDDCNLAGAFVITNDVRAELLPHAREIAQHWMRKAAQVG
jgi:hypothetical protein